MAHHVGTRHDVTCVASHDVGVEYVGMHVATSVAVHYIAYTRDGGQLWLTWAKHGTRAGVSAHLQGNGWMQLIVSCGG